LKELRETGISGKKAKAEGEDEGDESLKVKKRKAIGGKKTQQPQKNYKKKRN
jgi:hypothetical protein